MECLSRWVTLKEKKKRKLNSKQRLEIDCSQNKMSFLIINVSTASFHHSVLVEFTIGFSL